MSDITARPQDFALAEPTRAKSRGYLATVLRRLRYDYVTLFFLTLIILIVLTAVVRAAAGAVRSQQDQHDLSAQADGLQELPARHR